MDKFIIQGGIALHGEITPSGNKNSALPLFAACTLTNEPVVLNNIPQIRDVSTMRALLESLGVQIDQISEHSWRVHARNVRSADLDPDLCKQIRASILLAGPVLARTGEMRIPPPGGDVIGRRRVDTHILALRSLGAEAEFDRAKKVYHFRSSKLRGTNILLDEASVTATENAIMVAVTASGTTIIRNAASEPHVQELCHFLNRLGANIHHIGSNKDRKSVV
jgi:UDP-N-acetylglucosamine 1-carboxyvinyltransferase